MVLADRLEHERFERVKQNLETCGHHEDNHDERTDVLHPRCVEEILAANSDERHELDPAVTEGFLPIRDNRLVLRRTSNANLVTTNEERNERAHAGHGHGPEAFVIPHLERDIPAQRRIIGRPVAREGLDGIEPDLRREHEQTQADYQAKEAFDLFAPKRVFAVLRQPCHEHRADHQARLEDVRRVVKPVRRDER